MLLFPHSLCAPSLVLHPDIEMISFDPRRETLTRPSRDRQVLLMAPDAREFRIMAVNATVEVH